MDANNPTDVLVLIRMLTNHKELGGHPIRQAVDSMFPPPPIKNDEREYLDLSSAEHDVLTDALMKVLKMYRTRNKAEYQLAARAILADLTQGWLSKAADGTMGKVSR